MINYPTNPNVGDIKEVGTRSWKWTGLSWLRTLFAKEVTFDTSSVGNGNVLPEDNTVQKAIQRLSDLNIPKTEIIDINSLPPYDPLLSYAAGVFVGYVNIESLDTQFQTPAIYQAVTTVEIGQTPETHPYDPVSELGIWWYSGTTKEVTSRSTAQGYVEAIAALSLITGYKHNDSVNVKTGTGTGTVAVYVFDSASTSNTNTVKPADIATGDPGRWVLRQNVGSEKSYTIDYPPLSTIAHDINMLDAATITNIAVSNVTNLWLTYSGGTQVPVTPGDVNISISAGETLIWEIGRTTEGLQAAVGVKLIIN